MGLASQDLLDGIRRILLPNESRFSQLVEGYFRPILPQKFNYLLPPSLSPLLDLEKRRPSEKRSQLARRWQASSVGNRPR